MHPSARYLIAGVILALGLLVIGDFIGSPIAGVSQQAAVLAMPDRLPSPATHAIHRPAHDGHQAIEFALAAHGNRQNIVPSFFTDLIRTMERAGVPPDLARQVAVTLARNPKLDELAAMTIAGCLPAYLAATGDDPDTALADLVSYIQRPAQHAGRVAILSPETAAKIEEKVLSGKPAAAELIMEHALLARFNPSLGARILVP